MPVRHRLAALALATTLLAPVAASAADDDYTAAYSSASTLINLCGANNPIADDACKEAGYDKLATQLDRAVRAVLAKAPAPVKPLLKRDQAFFYEMIIAAAEDMPRSESDEAKDEFVELLRQRVAALEKISFGRAGLSGKWQDAFGTVTVLPADDGAYRIAIDTNAVYGADDERRAQCRAIALVKPSAGGWLTGTLEQVKPVPPVADTQAAVIKIRRQGETLRVVASETEWENGNRPDCKTIHMVTANYFASGKDEAASDKGDTAFVMPTFDCTKPATASEEEICGDPDLADNDQRLNRAWKALLPRLDEATRHALTEDQRGYVKAQTWQYPIFLHPAWNKITSFMHFTSEARDRMNKMQRERLALLEGFDENRVGLAGVWLSSTAILNVTKADGGLSAEGWKWEQGDWKAGCDYAIAGDVVKGAFRSSEQRKNPDTLERDHAMLIVNRMDDAFARKRHGADGDDEPKCKRGYDRSSTARLFPAKPSADINDFGGSIR